VNVKVSTIVDVAVTVDLEMSENVMVVVINVSVEEEEKEEVKTSVTNGAGIVTVVTSRSMKRVEVAGVVTADVH